MTTEQYKTCPYISDCTASTRHEVGCNEHDYIMRCPERIERRAFDLEQEIQDLRERMDQMAR
jgi:hypothetical protein